MSCPRPSSSSRKSSLVRSLTMAPVLLRTLAYRLTTLTPVENVGLACSCCALCCCAPSRRRAGRRPRAENRLRREMDSSSAIDVLRDARNGSRVTYRIGGGTRGQTGLPAHFRQTAPEIHGSLVCPQPVLLFVVVVGAGGFADDVVYHFRGAGGIQIGGHAARGDTEHIAVMQFRSETTGAEFEPEAMHHVDVFWPETRRMRAQVEEHHVLLIFEHEFERKGGTRLGELLPILADLRALFGRRQFGREAHHDADR